MSKEDGSSISNDFQIKIYIEVLPNPKCNTISIHFVALYSILIIVKNGINIKF